MTDFFVSYTHADKQWAEWIAYVLEEEGYSTIIQAWDFRPGSNFVLEMQQAASAAKRTVMVLSPDYLNSKMAASEWASAFAQDPDGVQRRLVPVMVRECEPKGLLPAIVQIRIMGMEEEAARQVLIDGVRDSRSKPSKRPAFPGAVAVAEPKAFPGPSGTAAPKRSGVIPNMRKTWTDADRKRFLKQGFETIRKTFEQNLRQAAEDEPRLESDFTPTSAVDFSAELFLDGYSKCRCRVWLGNEMGSDNIGFQEGNTTGNAYNEMLYPATEGDLSFHASMAMGFHPNEKQFDMKHLSAEDAASYLWGRFVQPLSR
ncbi:TIR domain-containing protein [Rhizobium sp. PP-F2F-G36]|nr:TIR domain-containing protein [Rhizobium sp. PP-F2F-G36]